MTDDSDTNFAALDPVVADIATSDVVDFQLDVDLDGASLPLSDGILMVRFLAGFTGNALVNGAVSSGGDRTDANELVDWLGSQRDISMDIDGDGASLPLTDGILLVRYLAGFTGNSLIANAINSSGTRLTADAVTAWMDQYRIQSGTGSGPIAPTPLPFVQDEVPTSSIRRTVVDNPFVGPIQRPTDWINDTASGPVARTQFAVPPAAAKSIDSLFADNGLDWIDQVDTVSKHSLSAR